jgi:hypothetical protein
VVPLDGNHHLTPEQVGGQIAPDDIISGQKVLIISKGRTSQKCLDVTGGPGAVGNGVLIQMWDCLPGFPTNQQWEFFNHNSVEGSWQIRAVSSGKCLDVRGVSQANAALVQQWDCTGGANQRWSTEGLDSGIVGPLVSENSGKCLDVQGGEGDKANGTPVQQFDCLFPNGILVTNQTWFRGTF